MVPITANGDEIGLSNKEAGEELESVGLKEENAQMSFDQDEKKTEEEDGKKVDREQFSWWGIILPLTIIVFLIYIFRKLLKKSSQLFN